jgi:flagellar biosynthetic protein FliR
MAVRNDLALWLASCLLLSFRVAPLFVFAPPFTLTRVPKLFLWLFGMGIAATLVGAFPQNALLPDLRLSTLIIGAGRELALGLVPVLALHLMFAGLYVVGRMIDIQSGFGLALLIDPTTRTQKPVVGTLFAYLAGAMFFAMNGHQEVLRFFAASLELLPVGAAHGDGSVSELSSYLFITFLTAFGVGAATIVALFLADLSIAMLSRTVPQMNALLLGIEVKAILIILTLPISISVSAVMLAQMATTALRTMARLVQAHG